MFGIVRRSGFLAAALAVAGCTSGPDPRSEVPPAPVQAQRNYVELSARSEYVAFEPGQAWLTGAQLEAFRARLSPALLGRGHLVLVAPAMPGDGLSEARARWALVILREAGVSAVRSATALPTPDDTAAGVVLEIQQAMVSVPACEAYPRSIYVRIDEAASNRLLGCANTANLGLMVADPVDLARGRDLAPADAAPGVKAIEKYRTGGAKAEGGNPIAEAFAKAFGGKDK